MYNDEFELTFDLADAGPKKDCLLYTSDAADEL